MAHVLLARMRAKVAAFLGPGETVVAVFAATTHQQGIRDALNAIALVATIGWVTDLLPVSSLARFILAGLALIVALTALSDLSPSFFVASTDTELIVIRRRSLFRRAKITDRLPLGSISHIKDGFFEQFDIAGTTYWIAGPSADEARRLAKRHPPLGSR